VADFDADVTSVCANPVTTVHFRDRSTGGATSWTWKFQSPASSPGSAFQNPSFIYTTPGTYSVTLTIYKGTSSATITKTNYITVHPSPVVDFYATPLIGCPPLSVTFTNTSVAGGTGSNTYLWYLGPGAAPGTSTSSGPSATYTAGPNDVTLRVTNSFGCFESKTKKNYVDVYGLPNVNFTADKTDFCSSPGTAIFTAGVSGKSPFTYSWKFGDGNTGTGSPASSTYAFPPNSYSPKLIVTDGNGCKDSLTRLNYINIQSPVANFSAPASVCQGETVNFSNSSTPAGGTSSWSFGSTTNNPAYTFNTAGTFSITLTYNYRGCIANVTKTITVNPKPVADFTINPDTLCPPPTSVQFIPNGTYSNYWWNFGVTPPITSTSASPTYVYPKPGYFTPTLVVATSFGCKDTITKLNRVKIYDMFLEVMPKTQGETQGCKPFTVNFKYTFQTLVPDSIFKSYPYPIKTFTWDFGDNTPTSNLAQPTHTYTDTGTFTVTLSIVTQGGNCTKTATRIIKVGQKPHADFSATPTHICFKKSVQFTDLSTGPINLWVWDFGDGGAAYSQSPTYTYALNPGTFNVSLIVSHNGCPDTMTKPLLITVDSPKALFKIVPSCDTPTKITFLNKSLGATTWVWMFGDPLNSTSLANNPIFQYPSTGTYRPKLAAYNIASGCRDTFELPITITNPYVTFSAIDTTVCKDDTVTFTAALIGKPAKQYLWYVDNNTTPSKVAQGDPEFKFPFSTTGRHTVKAIIVDDDDCSYSLTKTNYVLVSKPNIQFIATPTVGCMPLTVYFTDNTTVPNGANIIQRIWRYGMSLTDTGVISGTTHTKIYNQKGFYSVKLIVKDDIGCADSLLKINYINADKPTSAFAVKDTTCLADTSFFTNFSIDSIRTHYWDFGDMTTSSLKNPKHVYSAPGSYTVTLVVTDTFGCKDTLVQPNAVTIVKPNPDFTMSDSVAVCPPLYVTFTNTSTNSVSYSWDFGNGNKSTFHNPKNLFTQAGIYKVVLTAKDNHQCTDSITKNVRIYGYTGAFSYAPLDGCIPLTVTFNAIVTNVASMEWDFSDGSVVKQLGPTITHTYMTPGAYVPKLVVSDVSGCKAISSGLDTIRPDAVYANFVADAPCEYHNVTLIDTSGWAWATLVKWKWTFHDGMTSTIKNPVRYYGAAGKYSVKLYVENARGCKDSITKDLIIHPPPVISAGADTIICLKDSTQLQTSGGVSYKWDITPYLSCLNCPTPYARPNERFQFFVTGIDSFNCTNRDSVWVDIKTKVTAISSPDGEICEKQSIQLNVKGANSYVWSPSDGLDNTTSSTPTASPLASIKYRVVSFEGSCIPDTDFVKITVNPLPTVKATGEATIIAGNSTNIQATGNRINKFKWSPAEYLSCDDCPDPTASPKKTTVYLVKVYTDKNCVDSDRITIKVLCDKSQVFIPNTFTPNGDGQNDVFYPRGVGLSTVKSFRIFNRWGELVFERQNIALNDESNGWDGKFRGTILPPDVYVYTMDAACDEGDTMTIKGDITIVR
jgi:gliding motility-associated-like protein